MASNKSAPLDFSMLAEKLKKTISDPKQKSLISVGSEMITPSKPEDFIIMPEWWQSITGGLLGIPFGYEVMVAGASDSGKTSAAIIAMKAAQEQGVAVILADTERKTTSERLKEWGVDPDRIARVSASHLEEMYRGIELWIDGIKSESPDTKILVVVDSLGNTPSFREAFVEDMEGSQQPGVAAKTNKRGLKRLIPRLVRDQIALFIINQYYDILGSHGKKNTGGTAPDYFSSLTFQTARVKWRYSTSKGVQIRTGATVAWTLYKNHLSLNSKLMNKTLLDITKDGISLASKGLVGEDEDE